jgi:WD40 repeat protein
VKTCPLCSTSYPGHHTHCSHDGALLIASRDFDPGTVIRGKYRIERLLGRGGMGAVYLAEHLLLGRMRALKFISSELSQDPALLKRFRREALAASELHHPNVVQVLDLDQAEDGAPFIAMEYIEGEDLGCLLAHGPLPVERALALARGIALGLGAAHAKHILHRDVKPANILLSREPDQPETAKLLDFGIAAVKETATAISHTRGLLLTPEYAAPEQWRGLPAEQQDGRVDLYALGGVLYQILTGRTCFRAQNLEGWMYNHLNTEPQPPSSLRPELNSWPGLDALVLRLLAKDRDQRPGSAAEVIASLDDIKFVAIQPRAIQPTVVEPLPAIAHPPILIADSAAAPPAQTIIDDSAVEPPAPTIADDSPSATIEPPFQRRSRLFWPSAIVLLLLLAVAAAWLFWPAHHPLPLPDNAVQNISPTPQKEPASVRPLPNPDNAAQSSTFSLQNDNASNVKELADVRPLRTLQGHSELVTSVAFSPDGRSLASGSGDNTVKLWDTASGQLLRTLYGRSLTVYSVAFSPDGRTLASGNFDKTVKLWDVASEQLLLTLQGQGYEDAFRSVAFSPDGRTLASGSKDNTIKLWDVSSGNLLRTLYGHTDSVESVAFSPDGRTLASGSGDKIIVLWDVNNGQLLRALHGHSDGITSVAFSPNGRTLASGSKDDTIKLWDVNSRKLLRTIQGHSNWIYSVAFSPNERTLASGSGDNTVKLWDAASGQLLHTLHDSGAVFSVAFNPNGHTLASGGDDHTVKLWDVSSLLK